MRKLMLIAAGLALLAGLLVAPALAAPVDDLAALASYFPDSSVMFFSIRTDAGALENLDGLLARLRRLLPPGAVTSTTLTEALDTAALAETGKLFAESIRPWLGDTLAVALTSLDFEAQTPSVQIAVAVRDRAAAVDFLALALATELETGDYVRLDRRDGVVFQQQQIQYRTPTVFTVQDEALLITFTETFTQPERALATSADFQAALARLPEASYDGLVYVKTGDINRLTLTMREQSGQPLPPLFRDLMDAAGSQMMGFALRDGRSLTLDVATLTGELQPLLDLGLTIPPVPPAFDPAFAARIPADAPLVIQGTAFGPLTINAFESLRVLGEALRQQLQQQPDSFFGQDRERAELLRNVNLGAAVTGFINLTFAGVTGLNLEREVLPWMDGDFALYLRGLPGNAELPALPDFAVVIESSQPDGPAQLVRALADAFDQYGLNYRREPVANGEALAITAPLRLLFPQELRGALAELSELDLLVGRSGDLLAIGSRKAVAYSLTPKGSNLADAPAYAEALGYALPDSQQFWFLNTRAFVPLVDELIRRGVSAANLRQLRPALGLFSSGSVSAVAQADGRSTARFVLTLAEAPLE